MKSKRLIVLISVLAFLTVLIVLNSTLFTLQTVNIKWLTETNYLKDDSDDIISRVNTGGSVFLVNKSKIIADLEKNHPYLRVVGIETKFPNKLVIHSAERSSLFAIELSGNEYAVVDELGKVLMLAGNSISIGSDLGARPIIVRYINSSLNPSDFEEGEDIKADGVRSLLKQLAYTLREANYLPYNSKGLFLNITVKNEGNRTVVSMETRKGIFITLEKAEEYTTEKFMVGLAAYNDIQQDVFSGEIEVRYIESEGVCRAFYKSTSN